MALSPLVSTGRLISSGIQKVAANGTAEALGSGSCNLVIVQACTDNTGNVTVGDSNVVAAAATQRGITLTPGDIIPIGTHDLSAVYVDSITNDDGVTFLAFE